MNIKRHASAAALVCAALLAGCSYDKNAVQTIDGPLPGSAVKFFNFGVNAPGVNFYANDTKITAITSTTGAEVATGVAYGAAGTGGFYDAVAPGQYTLTGRIAAVIDKDLAISSLSAQLADGKRYSYFMSGFYNTTTKTVESFIVEDPLPAVDASVAYVRFVNAISNAGATALSAKHATTGVITPLGGDVAYKAAGGFVALPPGTYDLSARVSGAATDLVVRTAQSFANGRVYTIATRGDATLPSTGTNANRPQLDNTANR